MARLVVIADATTLQLRSRVFGALSSDEIEILDPEIFQEVSSEQNILVLAPSDCSPSIQRIVSEILGREDPAVRGVIKEVACRTTLFYNMTNVFARDQVIRLAYGPSLFHVTDALASNLLGQEKQADGTYIGCTRYETWKWHATGAGPWVKSVDNPFPVVPDAGIYHRAVTWAITIDWAQAYGHYSTHIECFLAVNARRTWSTNGVTTKSLTKTQTKIHYRQPDADLPEDYEETKAKSCE